MKPAPSVLVGFTRLSPGAQLPITRHSVGHQMVFARQPGLRQSFTWSAPSLLATMTTQPGLRLGFSWSAGLYPTFTVFLLTLTWISLAFRMTTQRPSCFWFLTLLSYCGQECIANADLRDLMQTLKETCIKCKPS